MISILLNVRFSTESLLGLVTRYTFGNHIYPVAIRNRKCLSRFFVESKLLVFSVFNVLLWFFLSSSCVLCAQCCLCLWIVHSELHPSVFSFSLTFMYLVLINAFNFYIIFILATINRIRQRYP